MTLPRFGIVIINDGLGTRFVSPSGYTFDPREARKFSYERAQVLCERLQREHPDIRAWTEELEGQSK